jgi:prepilin-type N-terminal cleavage/methylation domain-containing protein
MFKNTKGFTLVELLAVIVILAIILAIAVPGITGIISSAKKGSFESDVKMIITGIEYKILESTVTGTAAPDVDAAALTTEAELAELANYGADPANYTSFQITSLAPVTISLTSASTSEFGAWATTGATKSSVTATAQ